MARWQRRARSGLGLFAVAFAVVRLVVRSASAAKRRSRRQPIERLDPKATSEIRGGDVVQLKGAKRDVRVEFASQVSYTDGRTKFTSFKAHRRRSRRPLVRDLRARSVRSAPSSAPTTSSGDVTLEDLGWPDSDDAAGQRSPRPRASSAARARCSSSAIARPGLASASPTTGTLDRLALLDRPSSTSRRQRTQRRRCRSTSGSAGYSRAERYMRFEREHAHGADGPGDRSRSTRRSSCCAIATSPSTSSCAADRGSRQRRRQLAAGDAGARHQPALRGPTGGRCEQTHPGRPARRFNSDVRSRGRAQQLRGEFDRRVARA